jgi:hypothetical protein
MPATLLPTTQPDLPTALTGAASLLAAAALVSAAGGVPVSVTVSDTDISVQISRHAGDQAERSATVAAYAQVLHAEVSRRPSSGGDGWIETRSVIGGHPVHVWTLIDGQEP